MATFVGLFVFLYILGCICSAVFGVVWCVCYALLLWGLVFVLSTCMSSGTKYLEYKRDSASDN